MSNSAWWAGAVGYEVYLRSFADSDGDGVGDLRGLHDRLDYLAWLGVQIVWITPFYLSPMHDHGYDVADYRAVDPAFGSLQDFDDVVTRAHELGLRVIVDLVPNHSSSLHPWFREARSARDNPYRDYYIWRDGRDGGPPNNWVSMFGGPAWSYDQHTDQWWLHLFLPEQPDLNWRNPAVRDEFDEILRFWLQRGVDGFRIDVAHALIKHVDLPDVPAALFVEDVHALEDDVVPSDWQRFSHPYDIDQLEVTEIYQRWREVVAPFDGLLLGEVYLHDATKLARYLNPQDGLHSAFWFRPLHIRWSAAAISEALQSASRHMPDHLAWVQSSHDRPRAATRFGGGKVGRARALVLATLYMGLPGLPFLYMGEELGLEDVLVPAERSQDPIALRRMTPKRARDNCRTPMPWKPEPGLGFTSADDAWLPLTGRSAADTVAVQQDDAGSQLHLWRRLIAARKMLVQSNGAQAGEVVWLDLDRDVVAYRRSTAHKAVVVVANCGVQAVEISLPQGRWQRVFDSTPHGHSTNDALQGRCELAPLQALILTES